MCRPFRTACGAKKENEIVAITEITNTKKETVWTPTLIRLLRGKRTQAELGELLGVHKNTVWRWEAGQAAPDRDRAGRLSRLAEKERFLEGWKLEGSLRFLGDFDEDSGRISKTVMKSIVRTARQLLE
jgi:transcriptional regulator with XRE-family HTH domain